MEFDRMENQENMEVLERLSAKSQNRLQSDFWYLKPQKEKQQQRKHENLQSDFN